MKEELELYRLVYHVLLRLIQFGTYRHGDKLPTIENAASQLLVSPDTVRSAYLRLKREGYISLTKNVGAVVRARYSPSEIQGHIRTFFAQRRTALYDLSRCVGPLLGRAQYIGLRYAQPDTLRTMEQLSQEGTAVPWVMLLHFRQKYASLENGMLMRLVWKIYMFFYAPFLSIPGNLKYLSDAEGYVPNLIRLCRIHDWAGLQNAAVKFQDEFSRVMRKFLDEAIPEQSDGEEIAFDWDSYSKPAQRCYSLAMELLLEIHRGVYPAGSLLPTLEQLAKERGVSVSTVRRAQALLLSAGVIKGTRKVGTRVLPPDQAAASCDFSQPAIRRRCLHMAQSLQILVLSCREVSRLTVASLKAEERRRWKERLREAVQTSGYRAGIFAVIELIVAAAPCQTIRLVYTQLLRQLFWHSALDNGDRPVKRWDALLPTRFERLAAGLDEADPSAFSEALEEMMLQELKSSVQFMSRLGIREAEAILIPE